MPVPTINEYDESTFSDDHSVDELSSSASWVAGDIVLVFGQLSNNVNATLGTPTVSSGSGEGLSFSLVTSVNVNNDSNDTAVYLWRADAAGTGSGQIASVTTTGGGAIAIGINVYVCRGATALGTPVIMDGQNAKTISITTEQANSIVVWAMSDWDVTTDVSVTATPSGTIRQASLVSTQATFFSGNTDDLGAIGTYACGIANHTGSVDMSGIAIEVKGTAAGIAVRTISTPARNTSHTGAVGYTITSTTAGDLLIACVAYYNGEGRTITGITGGGTWAKAIGQALDANSHQEIWYAHNVTGSVTSITITMNDDGSPLSVVQATVLHCSDAATASALDVVPTATTGTGTTPSITSGTLSQADEIIVQMNSHTGADLTTMTEDTGDGFSEANQNLDNDDGQTFEAQYKVVAATTSLAVSATYNASRDWGAILVSFKGAAAEEGGSDGPSTEMDITSYPKEAMRYPR